ncbi:MAG: PSD1 and planctomycete cytochrome C domain-containing protein [Fimbriimonadales bacterium]
MRPLLAQHCWPCHGQDKDALKKKGGVSLDTFAGATATYGRVHPIVPGQPEKSEMISRITAPDAELRMPPKDSGIKPLTPSEIETIRTWIKEGAEFRAHWAFTAPKPPVLPRVKDTKWAKNDIDRFVLAHLEEEGIHPEPEADKRTLIRRATLTLTGLPPTPQEVSSFLADKRPDAYERLVDRLLASPRYGENQARYWLDAVRYADTHGLHIDNERSIFPYRDWVVRAFNEDLPFDKFTVWQLAGDLLPNPTLDQQIATGYVRLNPTTNEGGVIEAEFLAKNTFDRVDTTATVFLGVTLQCAKCHDHKYDPFTQRDYYSMYAYFDSTADTPLDGNLRLHEPVMKAPTPEQAQRMSVLNLQMKAIEAKTDPAEAKRWAIAAGATLPSASKWEISGPYAAKDFESAYATNFGPEPGGAPGATWKPVKFELEKPMAGLVGKENAAAYLRGTLKVDKASKMDMRLGSDDGIKVWLNGALVHQNKVMRPLKANEDKVVVNLNAGENSLLVKIVNAGGEDGAFVGVGGPDTQKLVRVSQLAKMESLDTAQTGELVDAYLQLGPDSDSARKFRQLASDTKALDALIPMTYVAKELPMARPTFVLRRGQYDLPGDPVSRSIPKVFGAPPASNRLGLAKWIVDPTNPLTARVEVNKIWQQHFGAGLVKSSEDFGSRGDWPSNPQLLDYLACRFVKDGWSIKKLTRLILTSAAYRQSAAASAAKRAKDPDNTLLSRGPRFRLDAEVLRDTALYVSGLLIEKPGGHADKPYQPPGLWEIIAYPISDTAKYKQDHGDALYRRSLYLFWKRTSPPPAMMLFDAPMRESCVVRRSRTNTPTQALASLNETGFFEDARAMAQRVLRSKPDDASRIDYAFRLATGRSPSTQETGVVKGFLDVQLARYRAEPKEAEKTLAVGESSRDRTISAPEHAAWTLVCNMILNLDETLTQH